MITFLIIYILGLLGFAFHVYKLPHEERTRGRVIELFLLYQLVFGIGITSFLAFIGLTFLENIVSNYTAWPLCPYTQELANVNLAYGFLGLLCIRFRKTFWIAVVIGFSIWILGDAIHHFYDAVKHNNYSSGNVGALVYTDVFVPILLLITLYYYLKTHPEIVKY